MSNRMPAIAATTPTPSRETTTLLGDDGNAGPGGPPTYSVHVPWRADPLDTTLWHAIGVTAYLGMLGLYAAAAHHVGGSHVDTQLYWYLGGAALLAASGVSIGLRWDWRHHRALLIAWPVASLATTIAVGIIDPSATKSLPGTITITFAYIGLTCGRWRSPAMLPLGVAAFVVGGDKPLPEFLPTVMVTAVMWIVVAEVPAWLIANLEAQSELLRRMAQTDALTQLPDRRALGSRLSSNASHSAVVFLDLDNFKNHNDRHGHDAGDALLVSFAEALRSSIRDRDLAFRIGGDEFLLVLVDADHAEAQRVLERLRQNWTDTGAGVGFSAGIAVGEPDPVRVADERMYANKRARGLLDG